MSLVRPTLLAFSKNPTLEQLVVHAPALRTMSHRFVAGERLEQAIAAVLDLNDQGMLGTLDYLGENVDDAPAAHAAADEYLLALTALQAAGARCNVSVKLTQLGLDIGDEVCYANARRVVEYAAHTANFVRIDMESSDYTARTLAIYRRLRREFNSVGIVIQAYLHRSKADVQALIEEGMGYFRLCKGAYDEPEEIAYQDPERVTRELTDLVRQCMAPAARTRSTYAAIASHDEDVINFARAYAYRQEMPKDRYEFQMLYGIRRELQAVLVRQGYQVRIYVPYGTHWYPYFMRRLAERPANLAFFLRALTGD
jgi:proline dehydrogenase